MQWHASHNSAGERLVEHKKTCTKCGLNLDLSEFSKRASGSLNSRCKTCCRGAVRIQKPCVVCGTTFPATDKSKKKFCSAECRRQHDSEQQSQRLATDRKVRLGKQQLQKLENKEKFPEIFLEFADLPSGRKEALDANMDFYFTGLLCKNGHLAPKWTYNSLCVDCLKERKKESYSKFKSSDKYIEWLRKSNAEAKKRRAEDAEYRNRANDRSKRWASKNREHLAEYMKTQRNENPQFMMRDRLQSRLNFVLQNVGSRKSDTLEKYLGCSSKQLAEWIESQFTKEMSWDNRGKWNVDHVRPCASFDLTDEYQAKVCFNWRNLMPLGEIENKSKQAKYEPHNEAEWSFRMRELGYEGELFLLFEEGNGGL